MKIHSIDQPQDALKTSKINLARNDKNIKFSDVLNESIPAPDIQHKCEMRAVAPVLRPAMEICPNISCQETHAASGLLDTLEQYQQLLADPLASLKLIGPAVEKMERAAGEAEAIMGHLPDDNPIKSLMAETMASIGQEVERFQSGMYVDD